MPVILVYKRDGSTLEWEARKASIARCAMRKFTVRRSSKENMKTLKSRDNKLRELILYIARESEGDSAFGATKLNKLLFYADFLAYKSLGKPITNQEYQALDQGPAPRRLVPLLREMEEAGEIVIRQSDYFGYSQNRAIALRRPALNKFKPEEIALVAQLINTCLDRNARHMSDLSHRFAGWRLAKIGETIPYSVALISERKPNKTEIDYGHSLQSLAKKCLSSNVR